MTLGVFATTLLASAVVVAQPPTEAEEEKARALYKEAEELAAAEQWTDAANKYEEAYYLMPGKHGFAYKIGVAAWNAEDCIRAEKYLTHYRTYGDTSKHPEYLAEADRILNVIEFKPCAAPPPDPAETEASKKGCSVGTGSPGALGLFVLFVLARRRRAQ